MTARDNAKHFPDDAVWQEHCARVVAYFDYLAKNMPATRHNCREQEKAA